MNWGNLAVGNNSEVGLLFPDDNATLVTTFQFSGEINATGGQSIKNVTLYTNESGTLEPVDFVANPSGTFKEINSSVGIDLNAGASATDIGGIKFTANRTTNLLSIEKHPSDTSTIGYLLNADKSINVSIDFVGDIATLSNNLTVELIKGLDYYAAVDDGGGSYTERHQIVDPYPIQAQDMVFITGLDPGSGSIDSSARVWSIVNVTTGNETIFAVVNFTRTLVTNTLWTYQSCDNEGDCGFAPQNRTVRIPFLIDEVVSNASTPETDTQGYFVNITTMGTVPTAEFFYNDISQGSSINTNQGNATTFELRNQINVPTAVGSKQFYWQVTTGSNVFNSTFTNQTIREINLDTCNATFSVEYLNITFFNETLNQEVTNATITGTWFYSLSSQTTNKTFTLTNATENHRYRFCFSESNRTINTDYEIAYANSESQQRIFSFSGQLTNITTITNLFLLPTSLGLFSPFSTVFANGDSIADVKAVITRTLGASIVTITSGFTDSSGFITFFLNPDVTYSAVFSKTGFSDNTFSFVPTTQTRTVTMGGEVGSISNGTTILGNTSYNILPVNTTLNNNTDFTFGFNVTSSQPITLISMNITNASGFQVLFLSNSGAGFISQTLNTGENQTFIGRFLIQTSTETISVTKRWQIGDLFVGDYSIYRQFTLYMTYGFKDFIRFLIVLSIVIGTLIFMSRNELIESSESKIMVALLLIWGFSIVGWLDTGIITNSDTSGINKLAELSNQFGVAFLSTAGGMFFILRRIFIRRI